jgi:ADP-ribose pyrophosphatase YjhB (NUDIX family)
MHVIKNICLNCGKHGHQLRTCNEPITSYGIICFNLNSSLDINNSTIDQFIQKKMSLNLVNNEVTQYLCNKYININDYNYININNIKLIAKYYDKIKILMIRRKDSLNYIQFIRGKYDSKNKEEISKLFQLMTKDENIKIRTNNFDILWNNLWKKTAKNKLYQKEYNLSKSKFDELKANNFYNLLDDNKLSQYTEPEWGFPKGRKNYNENNIDCASREFYEETGVKASELYILQQLDCIEENYIGSDSINYKHIYYLGFVNNEVELSINNEQYYEVGDIKWLTIPEAISKIRPYYKNKKDIVYETYFYYINLINEIIKN